jgi:hypothetical protein
MCFNVQITGAMMLLNLGVGIYRKRQGDGWRRTQVRNAHPHQRAWASMDSAHAPCGACLIGRRACAPAASSSPLPPPLASLPTLSTPDLLRVLCDGAIAVLAVLCA